MVNNPDVEHLVAVHIDLPASQPKAGKAPSNGSHQIATLTKGRAVDTDLNRVIGLLNEFPIDALGPAELTGSLPSLQRTYARFVAGLIKAAIKATRRPTVDDPEGKVLIHPAMKLLTGDRNLAASKAADFLKRLLKLDPEAIEPLLSDPTLKETQEIAYRLRPTGQKRRSKARR